MARRKVDGRQEDSRTTSLAGTLHDIVAVSGKLLTVQMAVGVYVL
jgi:hypothetical protein